MQDPESSILWAKIILLGVIAVLVPLIMPRAYIPVNAKVSLFYSEVMPVLNASLEPNAATEPRTDVPSNIYDAP